MIQRVYVALGSNLAEPREQIQAALDAFERLPETRLVAVSPLYISDPLGPADQPRFVNGVAALDTNLAPLDLLDALQAIELEQGRVRDLRWGPRTLDLDILLFGEQLLDLPRLKVPHYHMQARAFVLYPLADLAPDLRLPDGRHLPELLAASNAFRAPDPACPPLRGYLAAGSSHCYRKADEGRRGWAYTARATAGSAAFGSGSNAVTMR